MPVIKEKPTCHHLVMYEVSASPREGYLRKARECTQEPRENGWCHTHQSGYLLMQLGASIRFVELHVGSDKDDRGRDQERPLIIGEGYSGWYACAVLIDEGGLKRVRDAVNEHRRSRE